MTLQTGIDVSPTGYILQHAARADISSISPCMGGPQTASDTDSSAAASTLYEDRSCAPITTPKAQERALPVWMILLLVSTLENDRRSSQLDANAALNGDRSDNFDGGPKIGGLPPRRLRRVVDHIEVHLGNEIPMAVLAELACVSETHFIRCFKQSVGLPPHRYIMRRRVERAKTMLLETSEAVVQIALSCGFADQSHLSTHFRRAMGTTPARFRRNSF